MALTIIERNVQLDLYDNDLTPSKIKAIALDSNTRYVGAEIHNGGQIYDVGQNTSVTLTIIRPDKTGVQVTGSTFQYTVGEGETVYGAYAELTQTALAISGTLLAQFMLTSGDQILRTEIFSIANGVALDAEVSEWAGEYQGYNLDELVQNVNESSAKVDAMEQDVSELKEDLSSIQTATASDVGKALKVKTVTDGKVSEWEFGEAGGRSSDNAVFYKETEVTRDNKLNNKQFFGSGGNSKASIAFSVGDRVEIKITTNGNDLKIRLIQDGTIVQTVVDDSSHVATTDEIINFTVEHDADAIQVYSKSSSRVTLDILTTLSVDLVDGNNQTLPINKYALKAEFDSAVGLLNDKVDSCTILADQNENRNVLIERINDAGGTKTIPCVINQGTPLKIVVSTEKNGLTIRLKNGDSVVDTIIESSGHPATTDEVFEVSPSGDCDTVVLWTQGKYSLNVSTVKNVEGTLTSGGVATVIDANQISGIDATRNYDLEAKTMIPNNGKLMTCLHVDMARKYFTPANLGGLLSEIVTAGYTTLQLHFSENEGFRFALDDMNVYANGTVYDLSTAIGKGVRVYQDPEDNNNYISQTEMTTLITQANAQGIKVIPSFDMPAHMGAILSKFTEFRSAEASSVLNFKDARAINFAYAILEKYANYFENMGCECFNIGADELVGFDLSTDETSSDAFVSFINGAMRIIIRHKMIPLIWNDTIGSTYVKDRINKGAIILFWSKKNNVQAYQLAQMGYRLLNMTSGMYTGPGTANTPHPESFVLFNFQGDYNHEYPIDNPLGAYLSIWCDRAAKEEYGANDGGDYVVSITSQYIADFGTVMKTQKKKITKSLQSAVTIPSGGIAQIPVDVTSTFTVKVLLDAYIANQPDLKCMGLTNVSCETDPINKSIKDGIVNVSFCNSGASDVSLTTNNSISIEFL